MQTRLGLHFVSFPGPSSSGDQVFSECSRCDLLPPPSLPLSFLGVQLVYLLRQMLTIQNPKKSVINEACLQFWGCEGPLPALAACHQSGMLCSRLALLSPLFCEWH